jgi:hypothetical protein
MSLSTVVVIVVAAVVVLVAYRLVGTWMRFRGVRLITCPENNLPAGVAVDARHAAATGVAAAAQLRLSDCTRWPEKQNCGQECLREIQDSPEDCLVRNILTAWYEGKDCALCGKPIGSIGAADAKPALLCGDRTVEWAEIAAEHLRDTLAEAKPVCFGCHTATSFARRHPELVIDRSRPA